MIKEKYDQIFEDAYKMLNEQQKSAVDRIEGPVLVNAGPGTGKTQILAVRIGKILKEQDVAPHNILCLTYTDAATIAMRNRLVEIVGPEAHKIHIYTFHGFCNQVIQENLQYFGGYKSLDQISDLERIEIFKSIIDNIQDDHYLKRFKSDRYFEIPRLRQLFELMKKEDLSVKDMKALVEHAIEQEKLKDEYYYKRNYKGNKKGDFNENKFSKQLEKYEPLRQAIDLFPQLDIELGKAERYDYQDMILWVINAFKQDADLLANYQERYLYFLVDEYQDTNGAQNHLLDLLVSYWDKPNLFVVGDDDQAIYKFQGANLNNIIEFNDRYQPYTIVLKDNYRSNQLILDTSKLLIENNVNRLVNKIDGLSKKLEAKGKYSKDSTKPKVLSFAKTSEELAFVASTLEQMLKGSPDSLQQTAIIYRYHRQIKDLVTVLEKRNIPHNIRRRINVLELPLIRNIINILKYIHEERQSFGKSKDRLFQILHYAYWDIDPVDLGRMALKVRQNSKKGEYPEWRSVITDKTLLDSLGLRRPEKIFSAAALLDGWIMESETITLQKLFEQILNLSGILESIMVAPDKSWQIQVVNTMFDFIKEETAKRPEMNIKELIEMIDTMIDNKIEMPVNKLVSSENGVHLITAHSAKGLEFKNVFIIGCTKDIWDSNSNRGGFRQYTYPEGINTDSVNTTEDERRLFYVAMTRAKQNLWLTYSEKKENDKDLGASMFVDEALVSPASEKQAQQVDESTVIEFYINLLKSESKTIELVEKDLIDNWLKSYKMSVTHLNKYLRCPLSFYFESILQIPHARNAYSGFGNAVHETLRLFFLKYMRHEEHSLEELQNLFSESMKKFKSHFTEKEFESYCTLGEQVMHALYEEKRTKWFEAKSFAIEEKIDAAEYKGVPLKGFLDKVEIYDNHVNVIDYKTGNFKKSTAKLKPPSDKDPNGGDYWRQLVFYKILLDSDKKHNWKMDKGAIEYVEPDSKSDEFKYHEAVITQDQIDTVGEQIVETYKNIKNYNFDKTCEEENCAWCNFVKENYVLDSSLIDEEYEQKQ